MAWDYFIVKNDLTHEAKIIMGRPTVIMKASDCGAFSSMSQISTPSYILVKSQSCTQRKFKTIPDKVDASPNFVAGQKA